MRILVPTTAIEAISVRGKNMKSTLVSVFVAIGLAGCATPAVVLKNETNGQIVRCGGGATGSMAGGLIGYNIEKDNDEKCVRDFEAQGFKRTQ